MKKPKLMVFQDALSPIDPAERRQIRQEVRNLLPDSTLVWIAAAIPNADEFDEVYKFSDEGPLVKTSPISAAISSPPQIHSKATRSSNPMDLVSNSILFSDLAPDHQRHIADQSKLVTMSADLCVYEAGDNADAAWLVVSGEVQTTRGPADDAQVVGTFVRPEVFGALDVMADCPRVMSAYTTKDSVLMRIDAGAIESVILSDAQVSRTLLRSLSQQWRP